MFSVDVLKEAEGLADSWLLLSAGWNLAVDGTSRVWKDCSSQGFVSGSRPQGPGVDQPHQPGIIQQQSAR